ncbi:type VII secretion protein EssB [Lactococcus garvieae]|uniref:type VII secretion protein EssB n=1 Tax=Lactococcus garvieae TaxID=1363 RepID=UPI003851D93F
MKCFDGQDTLTLKRKEDECTIFFTGTQINQEDLIFIKEQSDLEAAIDEDYVFQISYVVPRRFKSLSSLVLQAKTELDRLELALKLKRLMHPPFGYKVPFVHPENIILKEGELSFIHMGMKNSVTPMVLDEALFLTQYKALILSILNPKLSYDTLVGGERSLRDKFSQALVACSSIEEIAALLEEKFSHEKQKEEVSLLRVSKGRYNFFKYAGSAALILSIGMGVMTFIAQSKTLPKQEAIIAAQADFITNHYDKTLEDLKDYQPDALSKDARFVLASSSVHLADLSQTQKDTILNSLSSTTDDNTLNYWIYQGRGEFEKALDLAKNIGDDQLTLLAYTDLYEATKLNSSMNGDEKQKKLEEYSKAIQELSKSLGK